MFPEPLKIASSNLHGKWVNVANKTLYVING